MEVSALEKLALTHLLASFLNVIFPNPSCLLPSLCEHLHLQPSYLEFPTLGGHQLQVTKTSAQTDFNNELSVLAHRWDSPEVDGIHISMKKNVTLVLSKNLHTTFSLLCLQISISGRLSSTQQNECQQQDPQGMEERVVPQRKLWMVTGKGAED
jgi:hypothetical protein